MIDLQREFAEGIVFYFLSTFWRIIPTNKTFSSPSEMQRKWTNFLHQEWTVWRPLFTICAKTNIVKCLLLPDREIITQQINTSSTCRIGERRKIEFNDRRKKTWFLIVFSTTLCASVKGWGNCVWIPWEWIGLIEKFLDLKVDNTSCASLNISIFPLNYIRPY